MELVRPIEEQSFHRPAHVLPGTERSVRLGGVGTPRVAEFAVDEVGARMRMGRSARGT